MLWDPGGEKSENAFRQKYEVNPNKGCPGSLGPILPSLYFPYNSKENLFYIFHSQYYSQTGRLELKDSTRN